MGASSLSVSSATPTLTLTDACLEAFGIARPGLVFHSDRGSQYASKAFRRRLWRYRMRQSMSAKGNCYDNAVAESFFATLKKELVRDRPFDTRSAARTAVFEYIEVFYNRKRSHSHLGYENPTSFEACIANTDVA